MSGKSVSYLIVLNSGNCQNLESRRAFYRNVDGVVLVHSTANSKSHANLSRWILPFLDYAGEKLSSTSQSFKVQIGSNSTNTDIPILVGIIIM
jgi:catechol 2,3-dioxygenase-like lactoylglutathione lyase family enzyme